MYICIVCICIYTVYSIHTSMYMFIYIYICFFCYNLKTLTADHEIRKGSDGKELPGPRELQLGIFLPRSADLIDVRNFHVMQMNQWIAHDITLMATDSTG